MKNENERPAILIIEDDAAVAAALQRLLESDYVVEAAGTAEEGMARALAADFSVLITDLQMPGISGIELLRTLHPLRPQLPIILITAHHTMDTAIEAIKLGAFDYLLKPITNPEDFLKLVDKAATTAAAASKPDAAPESAHEPGTLIGRSSVMQSLYKEIGRAANRPVTVLVRGETGTGKELVARALHRYSERAGQPFIIVNCAAIPDALLESELFGHEPGSFSGAQGERVGKFEQAKQGTIFLDEIGDVSLATQAKLLRVLQEKVIRRIGGQEAIPVDVRVLAATHRDLERAVEEKRFRQDLYYRLNDASICLPALRERREDIPHLVSYFLHLQAAPPGGTRPTITADALRVLQYHSWPGNVRELKNVVQNAVVLAHGYPVDSEIVRRALVQTGAAQAEPNQYLEVYVAELLDEAETSTQQNVEQTLTEWAERELYSQAISLASGDQTKVARWLGVSRPTVRERLLHYGLHPGGADRPQEIP